MTDPNEKRESRFFAMDVKAPLKLCKIRLRTVSAYESAGARAPQNALEYLRSALNCLGSTPFLVTASPDIGRPSRVRSRKGIFFGNRKMLSLRMNSEEILLGDGLTRFFATVDLSDYSFDHSSQIILNWVSGFLVASDLPIEEIHGRIGIWLKSGKERLLPSLPFDFSVVTEDVAKLERLAIVRYIPAYNGRDEGIAVLGHECFVNERTRDCLLGVQAEASHAG